VSTHAPVSSALHWTQAAFVAEHTGFAAGHSASVVHGAHVPELGPESRHVPSMH
jgi:hypothetical protein